MSSKTYVIDIDGTICDTQTIDGVNDYKNSQPILHRIAYINSLYDAGHTINYWTARGTGSGIDWQSFTYNQLKNWGCKFHSCKTGKPSYDVWIDDKAINADDFFQD